eukprot:933744_1
MNNHIFLTFVSIWVMTISIDCDVVLRQNDFSDGTYRITIPGIYCLAEDITFNPNPPLLGESPNGVTAWFPTDQTLYPPSILTPSSSGAYILGFHAAITIETNDVTIDLQEHELKMGYEFYIQQRFFELISIGNSPFLTPVKAIADFGEFSPETVKNIIIQNGVLGLTSHHSILGNSNINIIIQDLKIKEFEVAGIQLNGFMNIKLKNLDIGPSTRRLPVTGFYAHGRFVLLAMNALLNEIETQAQPLPPPITFEGGRTLNIEEIFNNLRDSMDLVFNVITGKITETQAMIDPLYPSAKATFFNEFGIADGIAQTGILLNSKSIALFGFGTSEKNANDGISATIENVNIKQLQIHATERPMFYFDKCDDSGATTKTFSTGPFFDYFNLALTISKSHAALIDKHNENQSILNDISYIGNTLSDAQIALQEFADYVTVSGLDFRFGTNIATQLIDWAKGIADFESECVDFVCNAGIVFTTGRGILGMRIDGIDDVTIKDVTVFDLTNLTPLGSYACGNYMGPNDGGHPLSNALNNEGFMGSDVRGMAFIRGNAKIFGDNNEISDLKSYFGDVTAIDIFYNAMVDFASDSEIEISDLQSGYKLTRNTLSQLKSLQKTAYPNNFDVCVINIEESSEISGDIPQHLKMTKCIQGPAKIDSIDTSVSSDSTDAMIEKSNQIHGGTDDIMSMDYINISFSLGTTINLCAMVIVILFVIVIMCYYCNSGEIKRV